MPKDRQLQRAVLAELGWDAGVTASRLGVEANDGVVTLTGKVESYAQKHAAELATRRVKGVLAIAQRIQVEIPFERQRGDREIAAAILERLAWDVSIPENAIAVTVENGWVTLNGEVDRHYQRAAAELDVRPLHGVTGLSNMIAIKPHLDTAAIGNDIALALHRSWVPDPDAITVTAVDGHVTLTGTVHSWHARQVAAETAWGARGTVNVENLLAVL
ncbi:MAG: BON domain-containing protein [Pseudomonadota bacterium]